MRTTGDYYHLWIAAAKDQVFFASSIDKAFFVSLIQDILSPRRRRQSLALVAYSLTDFGLNLLVFSESPRLVEGFGQRLLLKYVDYLNQQRDWEQLPFDTIFVHDRLGDEHEALNISREIHLLHDDWRHDRYSSIGFYLDDRRGEWMQPWRLTRLFHNDSNWYKDFLLNDQEQSWQPAKLEFLET